MNSVKMSVAQNRHLGNPIVFTTEGGQHLFDGLDGNVVILDQKNELVHAIRHTLGQYASKHNEFEILTLPYDQIVTIKSNVSMNEINTFLDILKNDDVILNDEIDRIKNSLTSGK